MKAFLVSIIVTPKLGECGAETKHMIGVVEADNVGEARAKLDVETQELCLQRGKIRAHCPRIEIIPLRKISKTELQDVIETISSG